MFCCIGRFVTLDVLLLGVLLLGVLLLGVLLLGILLHWAFCYWAFCTHSINLAVVLFYTVRTGMVFQQDLSIFSSMDAFTH